MSSRPALILIGPSCAGKSTLAAMLVRQLDYKVIHAGSVMRSIAIKAGIDSGSPGRNSIEVMQLFGIDVVAHEIAAMHPEGINCAVDGFRSVGEVHTLQSRWSGLKLVKVDAAVEVRYGRAVRRARVRDKLGLEEWLREEALQEQMGLAELMSSTTEDLFVRNEGSMSDLRGHASRLMESLVSGRRAG